MKKIFSYFFGIFFICCFAFILSACVEFGTTPTEDVTPKQYIKNEHLLLEIGEGFTINLEDKELEDEFTYEIEDEEIVKIEDAVLTALAAGTTKVTITYDLKEESSKILIIEVTVKPQMEHQIIYRSILDEEFELIETVVDGATTTLADAPTVEGYVFQGWSTSSVYQLFVDKLENVNVDKTLYAWYELKTYQITYDLDGGTYNGQATILHGETISLGEAQKEGYTFLGWTKTKGSTSYISEIKGTSDMTIYANWQMNNLYPDGIYPITYNLDGGAWNVVYYTPTEIATQFLADFKSATGHTIEAERFDCAHMESSWFGDMMQNKTYLNKWLWLLNAIWKKAGGTDAQNPKTADFTNSSVKGLYIGNLCGFFTSTKHKDTYLGPESLDYADPAISNAICAAGPAKTKEVGPDSYKKGVGVSSFPSPVKAEYIFKGWVDQNGTKVTSISNTSEGPLTLKATWEHEVIALDVTFNNLPSDGLKIYEQLKLEWIVAPSAAVNKNVLFYSLTENILSVTEDGTIKAKAVGLGKIRVRLESNPSFEKVIEINVWNGNYFDVSYETVSYVAIGNTIKLNAKYVDSNQNYLNVSWLSLNPEIATVDESGVVIGLTEGVANIRATVINNPELTFDFYVTVVSLDLSEELQFVLNNHISNAQTTYNLNIGDEYYYDVVGGANNLLFDDLKIDRRYYDKLPSGTKNYGEMSSVEFITVHYTGNMRYSADADNNCSYFNDLDYRASIHFVTGRTNLTDLTGVSSGYTEDAYYAFAGLNEKYGGWHATNGDPCIWDDTGLYVLEGDPLTPIISISQNQKYTINGRETTIKIPTPPEGYTVNGDVLTVSGKQYTVFNKYGIIAKVENGKYYIARTHWGTQRSPRAICTCGGNRNSIGIESCVDIGSDLEHTWHVTAQLVAKLLKDYNLGFDRVVGHHFFSGKNCPQPFLEKDMKLWYEFMDMVKAEYELLTKFSDASISSKAVKSDGILRDNGLLKQDANAHCVTYEVTIEINGVKQTITLATCVESYLKYDGTRAKESLQMQDYPII